MFYPLSRGDRAYLLALFVFAGVALLPDYGARTFYGVHVLAWWMAALMLFSPLVALARLLLRRSS